MIPIFETNFPSSVAMKQIAHFGQLFGKRRFLKYDYGPKRNFDIYKRSTPPEYKLENCKVRVGIIYSEIDTLVPAKDVRRLPNELSNLIELRRVDDNTFNHIDFVWAKDAKELVYAYVLDWMKTEEEGQNNNDLLL